MLKCLQKPYSGTCALYYTEKHQNIKIHGNTCERLGPCATPGNAWMCSRHLADLEIGKTPGIRPEFSGCKEF